MAGGLECMPIFAFGLWSIFTDFLDPTPSHNRDSHPWYPSQDVGLTPCEQSYRSIRVNIP
jgi:hypothetical protein